MFLLICEWWLANKYFSQIWKWQIFDDASLGVMLLCHQINSLVCLQDEEGKEICYSKSVGHEKPGAYQVRVYFSIKHCSMWPLVIAAHLLYCSLFLYYIPSGNYFHTSISCFFLNVAENRFAFGLCFVAVIDHVISGTERHCSVACTLSIWG